MKMKRIIQVALLLFISVSVIYLVTEEVQRPVRAAAQSVPRAETARPAKVVVYYFHGNFRCVSCRKLEAVSREAVMTGFGLNFTIKPNLAA